MRIFKETQRFDQWWLRLIMAITVIVIIATAINTYPEVKDNKTDLFVFLGSSALGLLISIGIFFLKLETTINEKGLQYGFSPIFKQNKAIWEEIEKVYVRDYNAITEYGGWGIKFSFGKRGKAYNTKGDKGIQIVFKDGHKTLIGTQQPEQVSQIIAYYKNKRENPHNTL